jgi:hypothetical protein
MVILRVVDVRLVLNLLLLLLEGGRRRRKLLLLLLLLLLLELLKLLLLLLLLLQKELLLLLMVSILVVPRITRVWRVARNTSRSRDWGSTPSRPIPLPLIAILQFFIVFFLFN